MRNKDFDKLLKEAIILDAEEQGARMEPSAEPIPAEAQARFDAALNGTQKEPKKTNAAASSTQQPQPVKRAHRWLAYGLTAFSATAVVLVVALLLGTGGIRGAKAPEPGMPAEQPPMQAETTAAPELCEQPYEPTEPEPGGSGFGPALILNGKTLDVYTEHYFIEGTDDEIPLNAFLSSIGSYYVDSPYIKYQVQCSEIQGIRYIYDWELQVFALAEQYDAVVQAASAQGKTPTHADFQTINLMPEGVEMQAEAWLDHGTLESMLRKMGLNITIELDREENAIRVTMPETETAVVPDDPERPDLHLFTKEWQGYTCLFPETLAVYYASERELNSEAGEFVDGLDELRYEKVTKDKIAGADLSTWKAEDYIAFADSHIGSGRKNADRLEEIRRTEIVPGVTCLHLYHPDNEYYLSYAVPDFDGTDALFLIGISFDASGMDDFDSIVRRFITMNPDHARKQVIGVWETDDVPFLYLELLDDGTARILHLFGDYDIHAHYAWDMTSRNIVLLTFSDQTVVKTAELNTDTDAMTLTLADGSTIEATRTEDVVLPLLASDADRARNTVALPAVCPAYALGTSNKETIEGILFRYDLDGDGTEETISFRQSPEDGDTPVIVYIDETEYPLAELDTRDKVTKAILFQPDLTSDDLALAVTTEDIYADWNCTAILLLHGREVRKIKAETNDAYAYLSDGTLRITARCWLLGTYFGSRAYVGKDLEPDSEWYETGVLDRVKDMTREEQIEFNHLFEVVRDLPCTIDGKSAVIEPGTWVYLLRWKDTDDFAEIMTEDGRVALLAFTEEYDQTNDRYSYCIDGVDAETYFGNLCMAG